MAYLTHFIQNHKISHKLSYSQKALEIIKEVSEYLNATDEGNDIVSEPAVDYSYSLFSDIVHPRFPSVANPKFTFIDLFAGIGGFRIALQSLGGKCVFSSEWDANAQKTYFYNFGEIPYGDITKESIKNCIPDGFDVLCAGFPCQAFSIAGYRKGFEDTRGTLFFDVAEIIKRKRPKAVFLENVKNLYTHDNGKTFAVIKATLEELGYVVYHKVMNSMEYANVPQNRERIFIVCFDPNQVKNHHQFSFPERTELTHTIHDCIDPEINDKALFYGAKFIHYEELKRDMVSMDTIYQWRRQYVRENKSNVCPTLTANMGTGGHNVPLILTKYGIRKLSPKECINFQGYPKEYQFPTSIANSAKYKQAGNSVVVPLITKVCQNIISII
ncbi:MAG TPA: DNA (cytosine-5-)-methyltransferase [Porphyromonadaceae bacterium]|nr:DNA (cytosine-5-)-methyltransferase [Porphyromonadaceae bacterium]